MSIKKSSIMLLSAMAMAALLNGCGSSSKEGSPGGVARVADESVCRVCHSSTVDPVSKTIITADYATSSHNTANVGCEGCHGGGAQHNGVGPLPFPNPFASDRCVTCHTSADIAPLLALAKADFVGNKCAHCHTASGVGSVHGAAVTSTLPKGNDCVGCHDIAAPQHLPTQVNNNNNGVRAIVGEFSKWSHHVTGRAVTNADCAVCHLEGKESGGAIVVDPAYHMADNKIHLRNANDTLTDNMTKATTGAGGQSEYAWNPAAPDHTLMDQFCMSCHNGEGAVTAVAALAGAPTATVPRTAINPFGDTISNQYDQAIRPGVVAVYEQFDTGNTSHHAVRGQRYTTTTLPAAAFSNISAANNNPTYLNSAANGFNAATKASLSKTNLSKALVKNTANDIDGAAGTLVFGGATTPPFDSPTGFIGTLFETGKFITAYTTLGTTNTIKDTTTNHCGDCHSVGQYRAADVNLADGSYNKAVIGAHGSNNEYMLRNNQGTDVLTPQALVCFNCHAEAIYGNFGHEGTNSADADCNGDNYNVAGKVGRARLVADEGELDDEDFAAELASGKYRATGGGNLFAYKCANCHNSSDKKTFGGIHGNAGNASYTSYSSATTPGVGTALVLVTRKPYRFLPGLGNFRYNGGHNEEAWTRKVLTNASRQGCYTLNGASALSGGALPANNPNPSPTRAAASGNNVSSVAKVDDNGILGSWGACTDHGGSSFSGAGRSTTRTNLRPLTY